MTVRHVHATPQVDLLINNVAILSIAIHVRDTGYIQESSEAVHQ